MPAPCALAIAGLDPSGGAGIAADLRAFRAAGAWGCAAVAVVTVQSTAGMVRKVPIATADVIAQAGEVLRHQNVRAIKTGALGTADTVAAVAKLARASRPVPLVVDPVMAATRARKGSRLLDAGGLERMRELAAVATLVTPNAEEAEALVGRKVLSVDDAAAAARELVHRGARAALVKGGHLSGREAIDVLAVGERVIRFAALRVPRVEVHGTGCMLASLIAGKLAASDRDPGEDEVVAAVRWAKRTLARSIGKAFAVGDGLRVLEP